MKKTLRLIALTLALLLLGSCALAETAEFTTPDAIAHKAAAPIVADGDLSEWNLSDPLVIDQAEQVIRDLDFWKGASDLSGTVYVMWDETNLYLAAEITEDTPFGWMTGLPLDNMDNLKLFISTDPTADPYRIEYQTNDFLLYLMMDNEYWDTAFDRSMNKKTDAHDYLQRFTSKGLDGGEDVLTGYERAAQLTSTGFIYECVIPWANFSNSRIAVYTPVAGDSVKFDIAITDISYPCPGTEDIPQMAWTGDLMINYYPCVWGNLIFAE